VKDVEKFDYEINGYNRNQVNKFVNDVIKQTEAIIERVKSQEQEIKILREKVNYNQDIEETLKRAIQEINELKAKLEELSDKDYSLAIEEAKRNSSRIINNSLIRANEIDAQTEILQKNIEIYKKKLKSIVEQQLKVIDEIEILELED
jgi:cell division initiation protein